MGKPIDRIDRKIMNALLADARLTNQQLAEKIGLSPAPCWQRVKRLEKDGYIQGYVAILDQVLLGSSETVILEVTLDRHDDEAVENFGRAMAAMPEVLEVYLTTGEYDYFIKVAVPASGAIMLLPETRSHFHDEKNRLKSFVAERTAILDSLPATVEVVDAAGRVLSANAGFLAAQKGRQVGDVCYDRWSAGDVLTEDGEEISEAVKAVLEGRRPNFRCEYAVTGDTEQTWFQLDVSSMEGGGARAAVIMEMDITERKRAVARQRANEEELHRMQRLEALGQLTGGVAHDFNNLLTVVVGNAELLRDNLDLGDPRRDWAELVLLAAESGATLTARLLAFGRRQPMDVRPIDFARELLNVGLLLKRLIGDQVAVSMDVEPAQYYGLFDSAQFENAIINLCLNARDAMPDGGAIDISVRGYSSAQDQRDRPAEIAVGDYVVVSVRDEGHGMSPEVLARALEPFFTTKGQGRGTGLGLSTVHGFVKQAQGAVTIRSEPNMGTRVELWLPALRDALPEEDVPDSALLLGAGERILLTEDNPLVRQHVATQLQSLGYRVNAVGSPAAALDLLRRESDFDLLFTDIVMPGGMDGVDLARSARLIRPHISVLLTTGYIEAPALGAARADALDILPKPYRRAALAKRLRAHLTAMAEQDM